MLVAWIPSVLAGGALLGCSSDSGGGSVSSGDGRVQDGPPVPGAPPGADDPSNAGGAGEDDPSATPPPAGNNGDGDATDSGDGDATNMAAGDGDGDGDSTTTNDPPPPQAVCDAPPSCDSNPPLAHDACVFGPMTGGAFYLFREPHITTMGDPPVITAAVNLADPGTRDLAFPNPPRYLPEGGPDGRGAAQFDGVDDYGTTTGFDFAEGSNPSILVVLQYDDITDRNSWPVQISDGSQDAFLNGGHSRTMGSEDAWRANGHIIGNPHFIEYLMPGAANDLAPHLHETHAFAEGLEAAIDGTRFEGGGDQGVRGPITMVHVGTNARDFGYAAVQMSELVLAEGLTREQITAYHEYRIRCEYPSLGL